MLLPTIDKVLQKILRKLSLHCVTYAMLQDKYMLKVTLRCRLTKYFFLSLLQYTTQHKLPYKLLPFCKFNFTQKLL